MMIHLKQASPHVTNEYINALEKNRIPVTVRRSRGKDIDAALWAVGKQAIKKRATKLVALFNNS